MNWQDIKVSTDNTYFTFNDQPLFKRQFTEVLKFHAPGLAPVKDETGAYHIDISGNELYRERFTRTFGYYCNRAAVTEGDKWFHVNHKGERAYPGSYSWTGNFQENVCVVKDQNDEYYHINLSGERIYLQKYLYAGDYKNGIACVMDSQKSFTHINRVGAEIHGKRFKMLGVYHKGYAIAMDERGWLHIDRHGNELYKDRYSYLEPFYNGTALALDYRGEFNLISDSAHL